MAQFSVLVEPAMRLREAYPQLWDDFLTAVRHLAAQSAADMVAVDPAMLQKAQGMALFARELSSTLSSAPTLAEGLRNKRIKEALHNGGSSREAQGL